MRTPRPGWGGWVPAGWAAPDCGVSRGVVDRWMRTRALPYRRYLNLILVDPKAVRKLASAWKRERAKKLKREGRA